MLPTCTIMKLQFAFLLFLVVPLVDALAAPPNKELHVGVVLSLTGPAEVHSQAIRKGLELAKSELERDNWLVELNYQDDQTEATKAVSAFRALLGSGYKYFVGPTWEFQLEAALPIIQKSAAACFVPTNSSDVVKPTHNVFNFSPQRLKQSPLVSKWLTEHRYRSALVLTPNSTWGEVHKKIFSQAISEAKVTVSSYESFNYGADLALLRGLLLRNRDKSPEVILVTGGGGDIANIVRTRNLLAPGTPILSTADIRSALSSGALRTHELIEDDSVLGLRIGQRFVDRYQSYYGEAPELYSDRGYDALMVMAKAVENTNGSPEGIRNYLLTRFQYQGASGDITFDENGDIREANFELVPAKGT